MTRCFRITDTSAIRGNTETEVFGVKANYDEWKKHQFCPCKGVIGMLVCDAYIREGQLYLLECMYHCVVPVLSSCVEEISESYFRNNFREINASLAYDPTGSRCDEARTNEMMNSLFNNW